ncbi:MAG: peptide-methionine (S)-S-oxide reductase MsrA [Nanoarchaeota archaeon]|nr:peptide-methionine (S)-S-oxide reductase MsrA [Nanoarchaeota archaeon]
MEKATFGGGCFWGVEAAFRKIKGVTSTRVGYMGGQLENPSYEDVCTDSTGHAEVVEVTFDPAALKYEMLLETFWSVHDPTQVDKQGPDFGTQYRSVVFFHSKKQEELVKKSKEELEKLKRFKKPIATEIVQARTFYCAEDYHQQYLEKKGLASCPI